MSELVFKKSELKKDFSQLNKLVYGFPKTGKSTLASEMKHGGKQPLFISTEDGLGNLEVFSQRVDSWEKFLKVKDYIIANTAQVQKEFCSIVVDLVSDLDDMCTAYITEKYKVKALADLDYGKGFQLQGAEFQNGIRGLFSVLPVTFITHSKEKEITYNGEKTKLQAPTLSSRCMDYINGKVDLIGFIIPANSKNEKPMLSFRPGMMAIAGTRFPHMAKEFILDYSDMAGSYAKINETFNAGVK